MKLYLIAALFLLSSCSTVANSEAEKLIGVWGNSESRPSGATTIKVESLAVFKADGAYEWSVAEGTAAPVTTAGTYKVGAYGARISAVLYNSSGGIATNALYFRFVKGDGETDNLETSLHSSFAQSKIWIKK